MLNIQIKQFVMIAVLAGIGIANAQDSATFDTKSGTWRLYYKDTESEQWVTKGYVARTDIRPGIKSALHWNGTQFLYDYSIKNQRGAKQNISVIRVWGIPLAYSVPNLPPLTIDVKVDPEGEDRQQWARLRAKRKFEREVVKGPAGWSAGLRVDTKVNQTSFVWTPGLKDSDSNGIVPGTTERGFSVHRTELPGIARTYLQGQIEEPWGLDNLPNTPFWNQKVDEIQDQDFLLVPVLAPVIEIPQPYSGGELARRVKTHVQTWLQYEHISAATLDQLNRQFDVLIPALDATNKPAARLAAMEIFKELFRHHAGLNHHKLEEDDQDQIAEAKPRKGGTVGSVQTVAVVAVDRIAARALAYNLMYLLTRMEMGR